MSRKVTWRLAEERDRTAIDAMHQEMESKIGRKMDHPNFMEQPVVGTVVAEVDGVVVQGLFGEAELEICACSPHVLSAKEMEEGVRMLEKIAADYKIRLARCFVPKALLPVSKRKRLSAIERTLKRFGFVREDEQQFAQFFRWLNKGD